MAQAPEVYMGKSKVFEELFVAPHNYPSRSDALHKLNSIREGHPFSSGWIEIGFNIKQLSDGSWYLEVHHAKYE